MTVKTDPSAYADTLQTGSLAAVLLVPDRYQRLLVECRKLVAAELRGKGVFVRNALRLAQRAKPDLTERALQHLLPGFVRELQPLYEAWRVESRASFRTYLVARDAEVAQALLAVADRQIQGIRSLRVHASYDRLRARAQREVGAAVPALAAILARYVDERVPVTPAANRGYARAAAGDYRSVAVTS